MRQTNSTLAWPKLFTSTFRDRLLCQRLTRALLTSDDLSQSLSVVISTQFESDIGRLVSGSSLLL